MRRQSALVLIVAVMVCVVSTAQADIGPKPALKIALPKELAIQVDDGELLLCQQPDCADAKPLEALGPQYFFCAESGCSGMAYGFAPYLQLRLKLKSGQAMTSEVFQKKAFDAQFSAEQDGKILRVKEQ